MTWMEHLIRKPLAELEPYKPGKPVGEVQREYGLREIIRLCSNENPWPLPERVLQAIREAAGDIHRYPDPAAYHLRRAIARHLGVSPQETIVGGGTEGILYAFFQALIDEGDEVVYPVPTYPIYRLAACAAGARCVTHPLREDHTVDVDGLVALCGERTKALVLCNPNNPTGNILPRADLLQMASQLEEKQVLLVVDEAYAEYVTDPRYVSGVDLFRQLGNIVILRTFSKIYGLAGLRVGYAIAPKPVVEAFAKVRRVFGVNSIGQAAALAALEGQDFIAQVRERTLVEKEKMVRGITETGVKVFSTQTNFVLLELPNAPAVYENLLRAGIIVRLGEDLGMPGTLRVTVGLPEENDRFLKELRRALRRLDR
ncbi:histidinol-phosphate transaminase [Aminomonas paucivorans]|uniref:histidinol-phosphate transaminase n=1 Tax=Aminomonas paucivorans TaxID=81412 RepID=UPI0033222F76